ncbi:MAG: endolytic transglycosylase MltG, partial [Betaproteobacteria bacterium]
MQRSSRTNTFSDRSRIGRGVARAITFLVVLSLLLMAAGGVWLARFATSPVTVPDDGLYFNIDRGLGVGQVARRLEGEGLVTDARAFVALVRILGKSGDIKAGSYQAEGNVTPLSLVDKLSRGEFAQGQVQFIEGWTFRQMRAALDAHPALTHDTKELTGEEILERLGIEETHPEGLFFPDTYHFSAGTSDLVILRQAYDKMQQVLAQAWETRDSNLPVRTKYQGLILASIVEKETGDPTEREMVAAVFVNRLRKGMRLQTDPTVIYGLGESFDGNLRKRDLLADQPYNTYTRYGLPPTPIALPGEAAIYATLRPAETRALYFVSRGDGTHVFSNSLKEHNR